MRMLPELARPRHGSGPLWTMLLWLMLGCSSNVAAGPGDQACPSDFGAAPRSSSLLLDFDKRSVPAVAKAQAAHPVPCFLPYVEVKEKQASGRLMLVDVRKPADYAQLRIPGSVNISSTALKTKAYLKQRAIVLVDAGYARRRLESLCGQLRAQGFSDVTALDGGLNAWIERGGAVSGNPLARMALSRLSARAFMAERGNPRWLVVDQNGVPLRTSTEPFAPPVTAWNLAGSAFAAPDSGSADQALQRMTKLADSRVSKGAGEPYFLVVSADGSGYEMLAARLRGASLHQVYFLDGGLAAYRRFLSDWRLRQHAHRVAMAPSASLCGARR